MPRSLVTVDLAAISHNAPTLLALLDGAELWVVVKADGYGHGAVDVATASLDTGATALCVATLAEALDVRSALPSARVVVLGGPASWTSVTCVGLGSSWASRPGTCPLTSRCT